MFVIYRITSIPSTNPSPLYQDDKDKLNIFCLQSFLRFFEEVDIDIIFLADNCSDYMLDYLRNVDNSSIIESKSDINATMVKSYEIAAELDDLVLFQECDYLYEGYDGDIFVSAIDKLGLVSPYDHLNFYKDRNLHSEQCRIKLIDNHHFRTTERNTMTWGCHTDLVKRNIDMLKDHGYLDGQVWYDLKDKGYELYVPIPSFATHMAKDWLAPGVEWEL